LGLNNFVTFTFSSNVISNIKTSFKFIISGAFERVSPPTAKTKTYYLASWVSVDYVQEVKALGPVHTYPDIFESANFSLRIRLPSTRIRRIRQRIRKKINTLSKVEKNISAANPITCGRVNPDIFLSDDVKSVSSLSPNNREF